MVNSFADDLFMDVLVAGVEAPGMASHGDDAGFLLNLQQLFGVGEGIRDGDFDHDVLASTHTLNALRGVHLGGGRKKHRFQAGLLQGFGKVGRPMGDLEPLGYLFSAGRIPAGERNDFYSLNVCQRFQVLDSKRTLTGQSDFHCVFTSTKAGGIARMSRLTLWGSRSLPAAFSEPHERSQQRLAAPQVTWLPQPS